jgi:hypothetical protein
MPDQPSLRGDTELRYRTALARIANADPHGTAGALARDVLLQPSEQPDPRVLANDLLDLRNDVVQFAREFQQPDSVERSILGAKQWHYDLLEHLTAYERTIEQMVDLLIPNQDELHQLLDERLADTWVSDD